MDIAKMTAGRVAGAVNRGEITARRLIELILDRCSELNGRLNIFVNLAGSEALKQADAVDRLVAGGKKLPLAGVPLTVKDDFCCIALPTTFGSPAFQDFIPPYNAAAVEKLTAAGAVVVGKTNLDDMSLGSTTAGSPGGPTLNPWSPDRLAGSAGAAAVASGQGLLALESDSGGSLRQGASHCGMFGLRPTMGRISRYGLNTACSSFGQVRITAASVEDIKVSLGLLTGFDQRDAATAICHQFDVSNPPGFDPQLTKAGWPSAAFEQIDDAYLNLFKQMRSRFEERGLKMVDLDLPLLPEALRAYYIIAIAEASSNLSRYDGIRFGRAAPAGDLEELYRKSRTRTFGREGRRRSIFGTFLLGKDNFDRYYRQALKVWSVVREEYTAAFTQCDLFLLPVVTRLPAPITEKSDFLRSYEEDLYCAPLSLAGLPSLTIPAGLANRLPVGLQLVGSPFSEEMLLATASMVMPEVMFPPDGSS